MGVGVHSCVGALWFGVVSRDAAHRCPLSVDGPTRVRLRPPLGNTESTKPGGVVTRAPVEVLSVYGHAGECACVSGSVCVARRHVCVCVCTRTRVCRALLIVSISTYAHAFDTHTTHTHTHTHTHSWRARTVHTGGIGVGSFGPFAFMGRFGGTDTCGGRGATTPLDTDAKAMVGSVEANPRLGRTPGCVFGL